MCNPRQLPVALTPGGAVTLLDDTIQIPFSAVGNDAPVVRPTLAVLFRLAIGPAADYYTPRFLKYERAGYGAPGWHWPALLFQCLWAFYRKLWLLGVFYALLTAAGAMTFASLAENVDDWSVPWLVCAVACVWLGPGIIAALVSTPLLYSRIRRLVKRAEEMSRDAAAAASMLAARRSTSWHGALLFGGGALMLALGPVAPQMRSAYEEHAVRAKISESLRATLAPATGDRGAMVALRRHPACVRRRIAGGVALVESAGRCRREPHQRPRAPGPRSVDPRAMGQDHTVGAGDRLAAADSLDVHPDRHPQALPPEGVPRPMNDDTFNLSIRKFLKMVGINSQREIERAVAKAIEDKAIAGTETLPARVTLEVAGLKLHAVFDGEIKLQ